MHLFNTDISTLALFVKDPKGILKTTFTRNQMQPSTNGWRTKCSQQVQPNKYFSAHSKAKQYLKNMDKNEVHI